MQSTRFALAGLAAVALTIAGAQSPASAGSGDLNVRWEMNESPGATVMSDSSGNGVNGTIGSAVTTGASYDGAFGYRWTKTNPNEFPAKPERLVVVDNDRLNPGSRNFAITMRFRTTHSAGNMLQKGQATNKGGYFKWQNVRGKVTCLVRGYDEQGTRLSKAVNTGTIPLNDGEWHTLTCARSVDKVTLTIDEGTANERTRRALGPTGSISNNVPMTLSGKPNCDQIKVTCDYFSGDMDYLRFTVSGGSDTGSGSADTMAPTITATTPAADDTGVRRGANVRATFSESVTGVSDATMTLTRVANGEPVAAAVTYNSTSHVATLNPDTYLPPNTPYTVELTSGIADDNGNSLSQVAWSFTTAG